MAPTLQSLIAQGEPETLELKCSTADLRRTGETLRLLELCGEHLGAVQVATVGPCAISLGDSNQETPMTKLITAAFVSLDGVMQAPGGPQEGPTGGFPFGGWVAPLADDPVFGEEIGHLFNQPFDLLLGRRTYEIFAAHWPHAEGGTDDFIAKRFNACTKYVATRSDMPLTWNESVRLEDPATEVARLKQGNGPTLVTQGSSDLLQTLLAHDLVDELMVMTFPLILGSGKKLFRDGVHPGALALTRSRVSPNGIVIATYERAGEVKTGDFAMDPPTAAELARREKLKREG